MGMSLHEPEQAKALYVIGGPRFLPLGGGHRARVSIRVSNRRDLDIKSESAQETHLAQHEDVISRWILAQQVRHPERATLGFHGPSLAGRSEERRVGKECR